MDLESWLGMARKWGEDNTKVTHTGHRKAGEVGGAPAAAAATTSALLDLGVVVVMYSPGPGVSYSL